MKWFYLYIGFIWTYLDSLPVHTSVNESNIENGIFLSINLSIVYTTILNQTIFYIPWNKLLQIFEHKEDAKSNNGKYSISTVPI